MEIKTEEFYCSFSYLKQRIKTSLNKNKINNLSDHYLRTFNLWQIKAKFYECLERHGNNYFEIFKLVRISKTGIKIIETKNNRLICKITAKTLQRTLQKLLYQSHQQKKNKRTFKLNL